MEVPLSLHKKALDKANAMKNPVKKAAVIAWIAIATDSDLRSFIDGSGEPHIPASKIKKWGK